MTSGFDHPDSLRNLLCRGEILVALTAEGNRGKIRPDPQLFGFALLYRGINLRIREVAELPGVVGVLVGDDDLADLLRGITRFLQRGDIVVAFYAHEDRRRRIRNRLRHFLRHSRIYQDDLFPVVDHEVLQTGAVAYTGIKSLRPLLTAKGKGLQHISVRIKFYRFDYHCFRFSFHTAQFPVLFILLRACSCLLLYIYYTLPIRPCQLQK